MDFNATTAVLEALAAAVLLRRWRASR
jgi:hypothetical protein